GTGALFRTAPEGSARRGASFVYRATLIAVLVHAYLMLRELLPLLRPDAVDAELLAVDRWLFGFEPALWLERFNHTPIVEWFAFFYFSYFFICAAFCFGFVLGRRPDRVTSEFIFGGCFVFFSGPLGYLLVPGVGPGVFQADAFTGPVQGGFFWDCVLAVVGAGGAMKDIFPSLHTALPCFFAAFCWFQWSRSRREDQPRRAWLAGGLVVTFFASNIVVSTMLLRWHYAIDVVAGLLLAATALYIAPRAVALESRSRRKAGLPAFDW
ncbi:MAG: phosphatase PAP2 family protein, partial [Myxococcota bacterium]